MTRRYDHVPQRQRPYSTEKLRQRVLTQSTFHGQEMHCSKSFHALVLFGVVALVTALYQSITPPSSALTIPTGLMPHHSVFDPGPFPLILMRQPALLPKPTLFCGPRPFWTEAFQCLPLLANRSYSSGAAEVATKTVTSWSNALDTLNEDQCGLFDGGAPRYHQSGPLDAPNDNQCAPNERVVASPEASATVCIGITRTIALSAHLEYASCSTNSY